MLRTNDAVALAWKQRGGLTGDDRDELIARGADPEAFMAPESGVRYLLVETPGAVGVIRSEGMSDDTPVYVVRTKPGVPCALAVDVDAAPTTGVGTVVIGPHPDDPSREIVWTAHPGLPIPPARGEDPFAEFEGGTVSLGVVRDRSGRSDLWLQTRVR